MCLQMESKREISNDGEAKKRKGERERESEETAMLKIVRKLSCCNTTL